ncbi:MAG: hypothetical protein IH859_04920 [Chloroflexi bacterium]|nr:hypothetical protein [Chloroflexota bacterium]
MRIILGVLEIEGSMSNPHVVKDVAPSFLAHPNPAFDPEAPFEAFPEAGVNYFFGDACVLVE